MRTIIVGDIHGCYNTLLEMLSKVAFTQDDVFCCVGDYIDRGNFSIDVLNFISSDTLKKKCLVRGNHDDKFLRYLKGHNVKVSLKDGNVGRHYDEIPHSIHKAEYIQLLDSIPLVKHVDAENTLVHAGFPSYINHKTVDEAFDKHRKVFMYIRHYADPLNGIDMRVNNKEMFFNQDLPMWYELYKEKEYGGTVFFGHQPGTEPVIVNGKTRIIGLDTGAVFGNKLCAYVLEEDKFYFVPTVKEDLDPNNVREIYEKG